MEREVLGTARVIFATLAVAGRARLAGGPLHADFLLVDEAAQATEPEVSHAYGP